MKYRVISFAVFMVVSALTVTVLAGSAEPDTVQLGDRQIAVSEGETVDRLSSNREALFLFSHLEKASSRLMISKY